MPMKTATKQNSGLRPWSRIGDGWIKSVVKGGMHALGYQIRRIPNASHAEYMRICDGIELLHNACEASELSRRTLGCAVQYLSYSQSQLLQDIFVLTALREKRNGFFVEFGARR